MKLAPLSAPCPPAANDDDDLPRGCGWFESSHELQSGLVVVEHDSPAVWAAALPLAEWLALHLSGWNGVRCAA